MEKEGKEGEGGGGGNAEKQFRERDLGSLMRLVLLPFPVPLFLVISGFLWKPHALPSELTPGTDVYQEYFKGGENKSQEVGAALYSRSVGSKCSGSTYPLTGLCDYTNQA